jgi:hypothetical protein
VQAQRIEKPSPGSLAGPVLVCALLVGYLVVTSAQASWTSGNRVGAIVNVLGLLVAVVAGLFVYRRLTSKTLPDPRLVQEKLSRDACRAELRLIVFAPSHVQASAVGRKLLGIAAGYRPFTLPSGNTLVPKRLVPACPDMRVLSPLGRGGLAGTSLLNVRELASLWHLPQGADDIAFVERTTARRRVPLPSTVARAVDGEGCRIGVAAHHGTSIPIFVPPSLLRRHLLAIAKTRRGKSSLLLQFVHSLMSAPIDQRGSLVLVDPHRDLASAALGLVPNERKRDVVYLDVSNRARPRSASISWTLHSDGTAIRRLETRYASSSVNSMASGVRAWRMPSDLR